MGSSRTPCLTFRLDGRLPLLDNLRAYHGFRRIVVGPARGGQEGTRALIALSEGRVTCP